MFIVGWAECTHKHLGRWISSGVPHSPTRAQAGEDGRKHCRSIHRSLSKNHGEQWVGGHWQMQDLDQTF